MYKRLVKTLVQNVSPPAGNTFAQLLSMIHTHPYHVWSSEKSKESTSIRSGSFISLFIFWSNWFIIPIIKKHRFGTLYKSHAKILSNNYIYYMKNCKYYKENGYFTRSNTIRPNPIQVLFGIWHLPKMRNVTKQR